MTRVSIPICDAILSLKDVIVRIKRNGLKGADSQIDTAILPRESIYDNIRGEVNNQNLHGYYPARDNANSVSGRTGSYQSLVTNAQVFNPNGAGLDLNNQGAQGGFSSHPTASQIAPRPGVESNSIDFSQSVT